MLADDANGESFCGIAVPAGFIKLSNLEQFLLLSDKEEKLQWDFFVCSWV